jgi:ABC-2 type transport system ATP-binding protein
MIIDVQNLTKIYKIRKGGSSMFRMFSRDFKEFRAVDDISFSINKGESVALLGPNGAGKTTTMKMLTGLIYPTSGRLEVLGYTPFDKKPEFLKRIGLVMGNKSGLDWDLTPRQSFQLFQKIYGIPKNKFKERVDLLTSLLSTEDFMDTQVRKLSLGERLKMEIVGSLLHDPEVLFLDEPTIGLDIISKQKVRNFFRKVQKETGVTLLLTSHDMDDIERVCDRVIVINNGRKIHDDSLSNLTSHYKKERYIKVIFRKMPDPPNVPDSEIVELGDETTTYKISQNNLSSFLAYVTAKFDILDVDILSIPLDEIISDLFQKSAN